MMNLGILLTGSVGILTTITSGWASWFFARKKYNVEVDSNEINNLKKSLEFYEQIVKDNNEKLTFYIKMAEENNVEVYRLKGVIHRLLNTACLDNDCINRKFYSEKDVREILGGSKYDKVMGKVKIKNEDKNEIKTN